MEVVICAGIFLVGAGVIIGKRIAGKPIEPLKWINNMGESWAQAVSRGTIDSHNQSLNQYNNSRAEARGSPY